MRMDEKWIEPIPAQEKYINRFGKDDRDVKDGKLLNGSMGRWTETEFGIDTVCT